MNKLGLYIHIPFCVKKCAYCDFLSFENTDFALHRQYVDAVKRELSYWEEVYGNKFIVDSIFIGGGTPSLLDANFIWEMMLLIKSTFSVEENAEITIECNPKTIDRQKLERYKDAGINRISIGVQSFHDGALKGLGRVHNAQEAKEAFQLARAVGFDNINLDLMFAMPEHNMQIWKETLEQAILLKPEHLSLYSLQLEEGTPFFELFEKDELKMVGDDLDRELYHYGVEALQKSGYEHYEISNFAMVDKECKHNLKYWSMGDYLGIGLGAHSYMNGERFSNTRDLNRYMNSLKEGVVLDDDGWIEWQHTNTDFDDMSEFVITGMRRGQGIDLADFDFKFDKDFFEVYKEKKKKIEDYIAEGYLVLAEGKLKFTAKGIDISNTILAEFV